MTGSTLLVLVAEDSEDLREAYVDWFVYKGVHAEQAASGPETVAVLRTAGTCLATPSSSDGPRRHSCKRS